MLTAPLPRPSTTRRKRRVVGAGSDVLCQVRPAAATRRCPARLARRCAPVLQAFSRVKKFGCVCKKLQGLQPLTRRYTPIPGTTAQDPVTLG